MPLGYLAPSQGDAQAAGQGWVCLRQGCRKVSRCMPALPPRPVVLHKWLMLDSDSPQCFLQLRGRRPYDLGPPVRNPPVQDTSGNEWLIQQAQQIRQVLTAYPTYFQRSKEPCVRGQLTRECGEANPSKLCLPISSQPLSLFPAFISASGTGQVSSAMSCSKFKCPLMLSPALCKGAVFGGGQQKVACSCLGNREISRGLKSKVKSV
jgi:hypothetical protein